MALITRFARSGVSISHVPLAVFPSNELYNPPKDLPMSLHGYKISAGFRKLCRNFDTFETSPLILCKRAKRELSQVVCRYKNDAPVGIEIRLRRPKINYPSFTCRIATLAPTEQRSHVPAVGRWNFKLCDF